MAIYRTIDLMNQISQIMRDGYPFVEVEYINDIEDSIDSIHFSVVDEFEDYIDYEGVDSVSETELDTIPPASDDDYIFPLTLDEVCTARYALENSLIYAKECKKDPSCSNESRNNIKKFSPKALNLQAEISKRIKPKKTHK